jgi:hypothetical protein
VKSLLAKIRAGSKKKNIGIPDLAVLESDLEYFRFVR